MGVVKITTGLYPYIEKVVGKGYIRHDRKERSDYLIDPPKKTRLRC